MTTILDVPGSNPPNPFFTPIDGLATSTKISLAVEETASDLIAAVTASSDPAHALWQLWDAFFTSITACSTSHNPHLALLDAIRLQPATQPNNVSLRSNARRQLHSYTQADGKLHWQTLPRFSAQWRDVHDILEAWRDWDGVRAPGAGNNFIGSKLSSSGAELYLRFNLFSAALLKATRGEGEVHPIWVFYKCRDVLERRKGTPSKNQPRAHRLSPELVWALDIQVAAACMRDGGEALWRTNREELGQHWGSALHKETEMWPREEGLTRERWQLWEERLRLLNTEVGHLDEETKAVVAEAADVVAALLAETST